MGLLKSIAQTRLITIYVRWRQQLGPGLLPMPIRQSTSSLSRYCGGAAVSVVFWLTSPVGRQYSKRKLCLLLGKVYYESFSVFTKPPKHLKSPTD